MLRPFHVELIIGSFLVGILLISFFVVPILIFYALLFLGVLLCMTRKRRLLFLGICVLAATGGIWRTESVFRHPAPLWDIAASEPRVTVEGFVDGDFEIATRNGKWPFRVKRITLEDGAVQEIDGRIQVFASSWIRPRFGQLLSLTGKLQRPNNGNDFDYISYLAKNDISTLMYQPTYDVPDEPLPLSFFENATRKIRQGIFAFRDKIGDSITASIRQPEAAYINGILLGTRGVIPPDLQDAFMRTGTTHILAISGYNITIVAALFLSLLAPLGPKRSFFFAVSGIVLFTIMVGASASVVRAALMGIIALFGRTLGRPGHVGIAILLSAALMGAYNPMILRWDVGFQLSFLAVVGIVYLEPLLRPAFQKMLRSKVVTSIVATTVAAQILVLPLLLFQFGIFATYTLPINLLVLPLVPIAMLFGCITGVAGLLVPFLGQLVGQVAWLVAAIELSIIRFGSQLPHAAVELSISAPLFVASYAALAMFLFSMYRGAPIDLAEKKS